MSCCQRFRLYFLVIIISFGTPLTVFARDLRTQTAGSTCYLPEDRAAECTQLLADILPDEPQFYVSYTNCNCGPAGPQFGCMSEKTVVGREWDAYTEEWRYVDSWVESDLLTNPNACALCTAPIVTPCESVSERYSRDDGVTVDDCARGDVYQEGRDGILTQCAFVTKDNPNDPESPRTCHAQLNIGGMPYAVEHGSSCCGDQDPPLDGGPGGDGAGDGVCGNGGPSGNAIQDCDPEDSRVQQGCHLGVFDIRLNFNPDYIERLRTNGINADDFTSPILMGLPERCDGSYNDANGDGIASIMSYSCGFQDQDEDNRPHHPMALEFPEIFQRATENSDLDCEVYVRLDGSVPVERQKITIEWVERRTDAPPIIREATPIDQIFRVFHEDTITIDASECRKLDPLNELSDRVCTSTITVAEDQRGKNISCRAHGFVGASNEYFREKLQWAMGPGMVVANRLLLGSFRHAVAQSEGSMEVRIVDECKAKLEQVHPALSASGRIDLHAALNGNWRLTQDGWHGRHQHDIAGPFEHYVEASEALSSPRWSVKPIYLTDDHLPAPRSLDLNIRQDVSMIDCTPRLEGTRNVVIENPSLRLTIHASSFSRSQIVSHAAQETQRFKDLIGFTLRGSTRDTLAIIVPIMPDSPIRLPLTFQPESFTRRGITLQFTVDDTENVTTTGSYGFTNSAIGEFVMLTRTDALFDSTFLHEMGHLVGKNCDEYDFDIFWTQKSSRSCKNRFPINSPHPRGVGMPHLDPDTPDIGYRSPSPRYFSVMGFTEFGSLIYPFTDQDQCELRSAYAGNCQNVE